ncbi:MAG: dephospho-CoA kinase [Bacilli bacterium]|nr:dephospho-CoA kinase [Bacilli bacterium]
MATTIGLTGGIATGKSTVSKMFQQLNIPVIDTDKIAYDLLKKGTEAYYEVVEVFTDDLLLSNLEINRKKLGKTIYYDEKKRKILNSIVHPKVKTIVLNEIKRLKDLGNNIIVVDVPLLFETDFVCFIDKTVVVYASYEDQLQRLIDRDKITEEYAKQKIASQMPVQEKVKRADYVIDNSFSILETKKVFNKIIEELEVK